MSSDDIAISVKNINKSFKLPHEKQSSLKGLFINLFNGKRSYEKQQVLKDISFDIKKGEFFGIVGRNGSGKSTLLKLLAGIYTPDSGHIQINGKLTPFIELGVGFNPELTGRENVFLNGALLGFNREEMEAMYDEIVAFAELEKFMDQKLKNYSSGMQVRLAFSIAIRADTEVLVLDEVLAVGDEAFQQKCISIFEKYKANKQTIVLVTHDMGVVERFCNRALMVKGGEVIKLGSPTMVSRLYSEENRSVFAKNQLDSSKRNNGQDIFTIKVIDKKTNKEVNRFKQGDKATVVLSWKHDNVKNLGVALVKQSGEYIFGPNTIKEPLKITTEKEARYEVELNIAAGQYYLKAGLFGEKAIDSIDFIDEGPNIIVEPKAGNNWGGVAYLNHKWELRI